MEIQTNHKYCIITPLSPKLDKRETTRILEEVNSHANLIIGFDLSYVEDCTIEFLNSAKNIKANLFNIPSDIFSLVNLMNLDKKINLFTTKEDFLSNKRQLLNRKFGIV